MKTCLDCGQSKDPFEHFNLNCRKADGFDTYCKACCKIRSKAAYDKRKLADPGWPARKGREARAKNPGRALAYQRAWALANPEKIRGYWKADYWRHRDKRLAEDKARREANIKLFLERERASMAKRLPQKLAAVKAWQKANPHKVRAQASKRRSIIKQRLPGWLTRGDFEMIEAFYALAKYLEDETGVEHHVDHILPLQGRYVSGLHVPLNLQVLTAKENLSKNNRWVPE